MSSQRPCQHPYSSITLPHQHPYIPVTLPHQLSYILVTLPCQRSYSYMLFVLPHDTLSLGHVMYGLPRVICTLPRVHSILVQLSPKMPKSSDTCHLLVMPHHHDVMLTSPIILLTSIVRHVDFDQFDFLYVWEIGQNTISFAYKIYLRKNIYGRNQRDDPDAMALVSSDSENFYF
jgi:hypothetical protein